VGLLVVVGELARPIADAAAQQPESGEIVFVSDATEADDYLREALRPGDVVLVKSSNASGLRLLGDRLAGEARA
jgi:UDP-N-acetylmuramoyl-tripeptide--D-alanyl-D-alanine ligase